MPLTLIKGRFRILHTAPDGDSVRFYPNDRTAFRKADIAARPNHAGGVQLRLDAIDALETHYTSRVAGGAIRHQPLEFARAAGALLLQALGFTGVERDEREMVTEATPGQTDGYILTRFADTYGRPVVFVYPGTSDQPDRSLVHIDAELVQHSVNYQLLAQGLVYPTYYSKLYPDLRRTLTVAAQAARDQNRGLWPLDTTTRGVEISGLDTITTDAVLLPKLFRRLIDYFALGDGSTSLASFKDFLATRNDRLFILSEGHLTGFDYVVDVAEQKVRLTHPPEDLIFVEA